MKWKGKEGEGNEGMHNRTWNEGEKWKTENGKKKQDNTNQRNKEMLVKAFGNVVFLLILEYKAKN